MATHRLAFAIIASGFALTAAAAAGEFTPVGEGGQYAFTDCPEPVAPSFDDAALRKIKRAPRARARAFKAYNAYVDELNAHFECLRVEADKDIQGYFAAVEAAFEDRQNKGLATADGLRDLLNAKQADPADIEVEETLLGAAPAPAASKPALDDPIGASVRPAVANGDDAAASPAKPGGDEGRAAESDVLEADEPPAF